MRSCVLTALTVLCLTGHLSTGAEHTRGHRNSQGSEAAEDLTPSSVTVDRHELIDSSGGRRNGSQPTLSEEGGSEALEEGTAALTWGAGVATPAGSNQSVFPSGREEDTTITPQEVFITTPQEDIVSTRQRDILITTQEDITIPPEDIPITTPYRDLITTTQEDISTHQAKSSITPREDILSIPPGDITATTTLQNINITSSQEDIVATTPVEGVDAIQEDIDTSQESVDRKEAKTVVFDAELEDGRVPLKSDQLVICSCPEATPDGCRRFLSDATIDGKDDLYEDARKPVADLDIVVHNVTCQKKDHRLMHFREGQFYYRVRGDLVLRDAGYLEGLRVNDFCADLHTDKDGDREWSITICVAPPSVPRCCPQGQSLKDGICKDANTPALLEPPMSAGLHENAIYWPIIKNHYHPLTCTKDPFKSIPLVPGESTLLSSYIGVLHIWNPADGHVLRKYTYPPDLCIDGYVDSYGSVVYSANICYSYPEELYRRMCSGHVCVRKCCQDDEEMNLSFYRCMPSNRTTYEPPFTSPPHEYRMVHGKPLCPYHNMRHNATLDSKGRFYFKGEPLTARDYCVDKFNDGKGKIEDKAMVCISEPTRPWSRARMVAFPICQIISVLFLMLTVGCYCLVPTMLQGGGWYQLFHVLSLMLGYASMFAQTMFSKTWGKTTCFAMGIVLQFGFLATFFWLNVLCFEVWRKIRSLNLFRAAAVIPIWAYMLYAFGVPIAIGTLTVCMQLFAPDGVPGLVKPNLAKSRCFFPDATSLFVYFYGPIALLFALNISFITHTYWTYRKFEKNAAILKRSDPENKCVRKMPMEQIHRKRDYIADFKQQFSLLVLMSLCWVSEVLSWLIPPLEMWALTDLLNTLQGVFIFFIFVANRSKRKHLKKKFPLPFKIGNYLRNAIQQCCCLVGKEACLTPISSFTSQVSRKLSSSSVVSNLSTFSTSLKFSKSSFSVSSNDLESNKSSVFESDKNITILSHSSLNLSSLSSPENSDTHC